MEFELDDDLIAVEDLASQVFGALAAVERVVAVERTEGGFDATLWKALADSGLLGLALPESAGGAGMGMLGLTTILQQQGRRVAPVPVWSVVAGAALPLAQFGTPEQIERYVPGIVDGSIVLTGAFDGNPGENAVLTAIRKGEDLVISGEIPSVPWAPGAAGVVVPVLCDDESVAVVVASADAAGVTVTPVAVTGQAADAAIGFDDVVIAAADVLPGDGTEIAEWTRRRIRLAIAALQLGVCEESLRMTAAYTSERMQFGRPLSTNQAVAVRAADAYIDTEAIRLTMRRAAWLIDTGREDEADAAVLVAKWWAARGGIRVGLTAQHLHGGIGADIDYPIHRYFLWGRQLSFTLGGADASAAALGDILDRAPSIGAAG
ncbi:acyl-CoA dehydrogenase family protein [Rhodococcus sp. NPDC058639]|uniref:acyl-CoA dehydrogenase family protein n=1 Tax=Rhodococcus sp. NPDC058639 TaxID=3346570 RepID=UPI00365E9A85